MSRTDRKELIASIIFDHLWEDPEARPTEETCHDLAEEILNALGTKIEPVKAWPTRKDDYPKGFCDLCNCPLPIHNVGCANRRPRY